MSRSFIDTNVLVYAVDRGEPAKSATAIALLEADRSYVLSTQVLGEFYVTVTRKLREPLDARAAEIAVTQLSRQSIVPTDRALVQAAIATSASAQISYWDALIVEAAVAGGCDRVLTEDLSDGSTIHGVTIVNPFA